MVAGLPELPTIWQLYVPESSSKAVNVSLEVVESLTTVPLDRLVLFAGTSQVNDSPNTTQRRLTSSPYVYIRGCADIIAVRVYACEGNDA